MQFLSPQLPQNEKPELPVPVAIFDAEAPPKLQGTVTLRILVTADGRAAQVRLVKGLSGDLDERAAQTVKSWRFIPAKDAARRSVPAWMTVEVLYRLF
jgi:periplasmic protein TonB